MASGHDISMEAIVLAATDVGEEDRILTFLTPANGLLRAAAGSARNLKKGRAAPLDLFVRTNLHIRVPGKDGKLKRVATAEVVDPFLGIRADYGRLCAAAYIGQTVAHCIQEDDQAPGAYDLVHYCLKRLDSGVSPYAVMLLFEMRFLCEMGLVPELHICQKCGDRAVGEVCISTAGGGIVHQHCVTATDSGPLSGGDLATLRFLAEKNLPSAARLALKEPEAKRLFHLLHAFSVHYLGFESKALEMMTEKLKIDY